MIVVEFMDSYHVNFNMGTPKRSDIVKLRDCEVAIQHCDIELQALATSFKEHFPGKPLPEGIDPLGKSIFTILSFNLLRQK